MWEIQKKGKWNSEKEMKNIEESRLNSESIWKIWKKGKFNVK
jgi:hypothetical protein